ncbi:MAG: SDR family NAD(P)-dependent oxidoreductase [Candidatus Nealsonbacteria bacterium]|nr:SDR family NAD(P)-dependent oxidoreductase [Candidatus Nealsonbacteria bacterium]
MKILNKTAIVTGARRGIGKGIASALAKEGYNIVVSDIDQNDCESVAKELEKSGIKAVGVKCDVSNKNEVENLFKIAKKEFGKVDVLVNNAGIFPFVSFEKMEEADWDKVLDINLKSIFLCSKEAIKIMPERGRIINISSIASFVGFEGLVHYCASKGGINAMIRALALELAPKKITVNAVAPGAIDTPGAKQESEEAVKQTIAIIPLARMGQPEDIANAVVFLASDKADYITGQTIIVDGGWTLR